jgi:acetoin utilization protein AcuB
MRIAEIMTTRVRTVSASDSATLAWDRMRMNRIHHLVVLHDDQIVGVVSDRDLGSAHGEDVREGRSVRDLMSPRVTEAAPTTTVREAANLMRGQRAGCLPVVDNGKLVGIVTVWDFLDLIGRGAARPAPHSERWVLKNRGEQPHAGAGAKLRQRAKVRVSR